MSERHRVLRFPIADLPDGEIMPPLAPDHPTWAQVRPWTDPLADRGAYNVRSAKERIRTLRGPAVAFSDDKHGARALIAGAPSWRDAEVVCRVRPLQAGVEKCYDGWFLADAHAGPVVRMESSRRYYAFCIVALDRLVLYRRMDDDWHVLAWKRVRRPRGAMTLRLEAVADRLSGRCPELGIELTAVDRAIPEGRCGFRSLGASRLDELDILMSPEEEAANRRRAEEERRRAERRGESVPDAVPAGTIDLGAGRTLLACSDFAAADRTDLLFDEADGLVARTWDGKELWRFAQRPAMHELGPARPGGGRRIYVMVGERSREAKTSVGGLQIADVVADELVALDGRDGRVLFRRALPDDPPAPGRLIKYDFSFEVGAAGERPGLDFVVRQWREGLGGGGVDLWAYDAAGGLLWQRRVETPYGHHNAVHVADVNRDGLPEVLAGGTCFSAGGDVLWVHDEADEMRRIAGAQHYDACLVQPPEVWPSAAPTVLLLGGSAGVYVVDALTGRTQCVHRVGHAQWGAWCAVRDDASTRQAMAGTRWSNYGILTLFDAEGRRLWSRQPDYVLQGSCAVRWSRSGPEHIWVNTSDEAMGLYDGDGRLVKALPALRAAFAGRTRMQVQGVALPRRPGGRHWLGLFDGAVLRLFRPEDSGEEG